MANSNTQKQNGIIYLGIMVFFIISLFVVWLQIQWIYFSRLMFWVTSGTILAGSLGFFIFLFVGMKKNDSFFGDFTDRILDNIYYILSIICLGAVLLSIFTINYWYNEGYSDYAIQKEMQLKNQIQEYEDILNVLTFQPVEDATNQSIEETILSLCQNPDYPCEQMQKSFGAYQEIKGGRDLANSIVRIWRH